MYAPERQAEFLLSNAIGARDCARALAAETLMWDIVLPETHAYTPP
jgi:hypothetical protein